MKQIEVFVDSVYQNVGGNKKEIQELKAEMKTHLLEAVHELKAEGKSEREAIDIAIERFGGEREIRSIVAELFRVQKVFAKKILLAAVALLVLGVIGFGLAGLSEFQHYQNIEKVGNEILSSLGPGTTISNDAKAIMTSSVEDNAFIYGVKANYLKDLKNSQSNFELFEEGQETSLLMTHFNTGFSKDDWSVEMEISNFDVVTYSSLFSGLVVYWVLFAIWAIINAYHQRRLNISWIVAFSILNVVGFLIYRLVGKRVQSNTLS